MLSDEQKLAAFPHLKAIARAAIAEATEAKSERDQALAQLHQARYERDVAKAKVDELQSQQAISFLPSPPRSKRPFEESLTPPAQCESF